MRVKEKQLNVLKWLICCSLLISLWPSAMLQKASAAVSGDFMYSISSGKATITSYNGADQDVIIPATLDGFTVNKIGLQAFKARNLTSVSIPNTITDIENSAFENNQLTMLTIPNSVTFIGSYAFSNNHLSVLTLSENVSSIGMSAFENNELQVLSIPESLSVINMYTFKNNKLTSLSLPEGLLFIFDNAFERNLLTNINLPSSLTNIGNSAFYDNKLTDLSIPNHVTTIGSNAFQANRLTSVHLSSSVTRIENSTFQNNQLTELTIPGGVNYVGQNAFESNQLTSISLPSSLTIIDHAAFAKNKITAVSFPNSLISIGNEAFQQNQLGNITIPSSVSSIGNRTFSTNQLSDITLSDGVGSIGSFAFEENQLTHVYIPSSVTEIHSLAFYHNPLAKAIVAGDSTLVNRSAFGESLDTSIIAFDPSPAKIQAGDSGQPFLNLLAEGVVFAPNGSMFGSTPDTVVTIGSPIPSGLPITVDYRWSSSEVQPAWTGEESSWTSLVSGAPLPVPGSDGPWYLHVRVDDGTHNAGFARSAMFQEKITHTVAFHSQGGSAVDSITGIVDGSTITEPNAPSRSGYTFAGWYTDGTYATAWNFSADPVNQNLTLFAKWTAIPISSPAAPAASELQITYTVSFDSRGGSVIPGISAVKAQSTINEPKEPERAGYSFEGWYTEAAYVTLWDFHSNKVMRNLTLFAKWTAEIPEETNFSDIVGHWANESILKAVKAGIVSGYPNGTFDPSRIVTRTEFLVMLMNALKPASEGADLMFTDAENIPAWGQQAVAQAVQTGIISGYADGTFLPNGHITRAEMALIIARALKIETEENATTRFADDSSIPVWAKGAVAALEKHGLMKGTGANQFNASSMANRAEAVTIILKLLEEYIN